MPKNSGKDLKALNTENQIFLDILSEYAQLVQIETDTLDDQKAVTANEFRLKHIKYVIKLIAKIKESIKSGKDLTSYPRIGKGTVEKIDEILKNKKLDEVDKLKEKLKSYIKRNDIVEELIEVIGIGRSVANELIDKYNIKSLEDLKNRVLSGKIIVNDKIMIGLKYAGKFKGKIPRKEIDEIAKKLKKLANKLKLEVVICGSYRRGLPTSNDIDVLIHTPKIKTMNDIKKSTLLKDFVNILKKEDFIKDDIAGDDINTKYMGFYQLKDNQIRRIDIRLIAEESFYTALTYFTGSYELNTIMRSKAKKLGYKLNEYGLYKDEEKIPINSEEELFNILEMEYIPPEERNII